MATHSSIPAWRIPWTEKPDGLRSMGSQRVGHDWVTHTHTKHSPFHPHNSEGPCFCCSEVTTDRSAEDQDHLQRPYQMLFASINNFNISTLFCLSLFFFFFFCFSCADPVFPVFPALEWKHFHICVPRLQQPLLLHSHPGSSHCWLMVGKIQVRMMGSYISKKLHRLNMQRYLF